MLALKRILLPILIAAMILPALSVSAVELPNLWEGIACEQVTGVEKDPDCTICHLFTLGNNLLEFLTKLASIGGAISVIVGGFYIMTAGLTGGSSQMQKGISIIKIGIIGTVIVFSAWMIVGLVFNVLSGQAEPWKFYQLKCK